MFSPEEDISIEEDIVGLNRLGILAGPSEWKEAFFLRAKHTLYNEPSIKEKFPESLSLLFDINPDYLEVEYTNEGISFWEGGCTWIWDNKVSIQLKKQFQSKDRFLRIYTKEEILAHEAVHAVRMKFHEPIFEEVLAYQTSKWAWRRFLGPLFRTPGESYLHFLFIFIGWGIALWNIQIGLGISFGAPIYFLSRLFYTHIYFARAASKIRKISHLNPLWILLRLTDQEIKFFASSTIEEIEAYIRKNKTKSIRWQQICASYNL